MKNRITLTNRILPPGRIISVAATLALLIATGAPTLAEPGQAGHALAPTPTTPTPALADVVPISPGTLGNPGITPPSVPTSPYGLTYAQWAAKYWQWALSFPATADPASDTAAPESGQTGPVWFLAGGLGSSFVNGQAAETPEIHRNKFTMTRQITVPEGTALFFAVLSVLEDNTGCPNYNNPLLIPPQLAEQALYVWSSLASATFCTIDGVPVNGLANPIYSPYLIQTPPFSYTLAAHDNLLAAAFDEPCIADGTEVGPAVGEGVFLMVAPLAAGGVHTIEFGGAAGPTAALRFAWDITYNITVTAGSARNRDRILQ